MAEFSKKITLPNILVVDSKDQESLRALTLEGYRRRLGPKGSVAEVRVIGVQSATKALDQFIESESADFRDRIHALLVPDAPDGLALAREIRDHFKGRDEKLPVAIFSNDLEQVDFAAISHVADALITAKDANTPQSLERQVDTFLERVVSAYPKRAGQFATVNVGQAEDSSPQLPVVELYPEDKQKIPAEGAKLDESEEEGPDNQVLDLRKDKKNELIAVLDLDGTLARPFTMERFVRFLVNSDEFHKLVEHLPANKRERSQTALDELSEMFKQWEKMEKQDRHENYSKFIEDTSQKYAQMLEGLPVDAVLSISSRWAQEDAPQYKYSYARPVIKMLKHLGIIPTLVTGTPEEAVSGFRTYFGIDERCHALELRQKEGLYTGAVKYLTGLSNAKRAVLSKMMARGHRPLFAMGDTEADYPLFNAVLRANGTAVYIGDDFEGIKNSYVEDYGDRRLMAVDKAFSTSAVLRAIAERLHFVSQTEQLSSDFRKRVNELLFQPNRLSQFINGEDDQ